MEKNINLAKILNGKPVNMKLWSPLFGDVYTSSICSEDTIIVVNHHAESSSFYNNGKYFNHAEAEPLLFPSKEMRDWSKFAWKKGDILVNKDAKVHIIFDRFEDDAYKNFHGQYYLWEEGGSMVSFEEDENYMQTSDFNKANKEDAQEYIHKIEKELGGKLNMETLEIEKPQPEVEFKPFDKVLCRNFKDDTWEADFFARLTRKEIDYTQSGKYLCVGDLWMYCIPYNEETAHLLGTTDEWKGGEQ